MKKLNNLPDLCLIMIFSKLPLLDLTQIGFVCRRWHSLLPAVTCTIRSIVIMVDNDPTRRIKSIFDLPYCELLKKEDGTPMWPQRKYSQCNTLCYRDNSEHGFDFCASQLVANTFTNVASLEIINYNYSCYSQSPIRHLLQRWRSQLVALKVKCSFDNKKFRNFNFERLFTCTVFHRPIYPLLKSLTVECADGYDNFVSLPNMPQLEQLYYHDRNSRELFEFFSDNESPKLKQIGYRFPIDTDRELPDYYKKGPQLCNKFTHLTYFFNSIRHLKASELARFSSHFTSLTQLYIDLGNSCYRQMLSSLSQLQHLTFLEVIINFKQFQSMSEQSCISFSQLHSIKVVKLRTSSMLQLSNLASLNIPWTFPSVQVISFTHPSNYHWDVLNCSCLFCEKKLDKSDKQDEMQQHLNYLQICPQLHHVFHVNDLLWKRN